MMENVKNVDKNDHFDTVGIPCPHIFSPYFKRCTKDGLKVVQTLNKTI